MIAICNHAILSVHSSPYCENKNKVLTKMAAINITFENII